MNPIVEDKMTLAEPTFDARGPFLELKDRHTLRYIRFSDIKEIATHHNSASGAIKEFTITLKLNDGREVQAEYSRKDFGMKTLDKLLGAVD